MSATVPEMKQAIKLVDVLVNTRDSSDMYIVCFVASKRMPQITPFQVRVSVSHVASNNELSQDRFHQLQITAESSSVHPIRAMCYIKFRSDPIQQLAHPNVA